MDDFKALLNKQVSTLTNEAKKATAAVTGADGSVKPAPKVTVPVAPEPTGALESNDVEKPRGLDHESPGRAKAGRRRKGGKEAGYQLNRITVNLFDTDTRALATISEKLAHAGHTFTNRSDSMKIGLRLASKASKEDLAALYEMVKKEDRRFRNEG